MIGTWFEKLTVILCDLNNLCLHKNKLQKPLECWDLKRRLGSVISSSGHGGWFFLAGLRVGLCCWDVLWREIWFRACGRWTILGVRKRLISFPVCWWMPPQQDPQGRSSINPGGCSCSGRRRVFLSLSSSLSTKEEQPPPKGQGSSSKSPKAFLVSCYWPARDFGQVMSPPGLNSLIYKLEEVTGIPRFLTFHKYCSFYKLKVCIKWVYWHHFSNSICSLCVCVSCFDNFHNIPTFSLFSYF